MGDGPSPKESPKPLPVPEAAKAPEAAEPPEALKALDALKGRPWAGEGLGPVPQSGLEAVYRDRGFLEWQNRKLLKILLFLCPLALISVLANGLMFVRSPEARYFAVGPDLRVLPLPALSEPILSGPALANWAGQAVIEALSLDFLDYRKKLMEASHNFTPPAFQSFLASLEKGGHLKKIESERLNLACALTDAPVIARSGLERGVMTWKIEMPVVLSFQDSKGILTRQSLLAELLVERVHPSRNPRGLAIRQLVLSKKG
jgi:intracellular multiplication protein IcmL